MLCINVCVVILLFLVAGFGFLPLLLSALKAIPLSSSALASRSAVLWWLQNRVLLSQGGGLLSDPTRGGYGQLLSERRQKGGYFLPPLSLNHLSSE